MMISQKMADAINDQIAFEFYSGWVYLSMAYQCETMGLKYLAQWFYIQETEEREHATKMAQYLLDQGAKVLLTKIDAPKNDFDTAEAIVAEAVEHEIIVTKKINKIVDIAVVEKDHATNQFLQWFVQEQVEEVASTTELLDIVKLATASNQMLMLENRLKEMVASRNTAEA